MSEVVYSEKYCSHCGNMNWDSKTGGYNESCQAKGRENQKCDTNGVELKYDAQNNIVP